MPGNTRSYEMAKRLVQFGHEVTIITSDRNPSSSSIYTSSESGICIHWLPIKYNNRFGFFRRLVSFFQFAYSSFLLAIKNEADIVFASSTPLTVALPGDFVSKKLNAPFIFEVRDLWPEVPIAMGELKNPILKFFAYKLAKFAYHNASHVITLSQDMADGVTKIMPTLSKVSVISNGANINLFSSIVTSETSIKNKYHIPSDCLLFVYAGAFGKVNGLDYLVYLAKEFLGDNRIIFLAIGDGKELNYINSLANELGILNQNFFIHSSVPKYELIKLLHEADIASSFVIPVKELESNCANKLFDGLASGSCFVINYGGWQSKLLAEYNCGITLSHTPFVGYKQLCNLIDHPELLNSMKTNAYNLAKSEFSYNYLAKKLETIFIGELM